MNGNNILLLFKNEEYDKAVLKIKKALKKDSDNGELFYYLFLAENRDYSNMDINNILSEVNFNKALELSNKSFRKKCEDEYHFFLECDNNFRKLFCYGCRRNVKGIIDSYKEVVDVKIPTDIDNFILLLNDLIGLWRGKKTLKFNLIILNLLYALSKEEKLLQPLEKILRKVQKIDNRFYNYEIIDNPVDMKAKMNYYIIDKYKEYFEKSNDDQLIINQYLDDEKEKTDKKTNKHKKIVIMIIELLIHTALLVTSFVYLFINVNWEFIVIFIIIAFFDSVSMFGKNCEDVDGKDIQGRSISWLMVLVWIIFLATQIGSLYV